jgi:sugar lactone lactonase YvrE
VTGAVMTAALASLAAAGPAAACTGDCDGDGLVSINELITGVNIALGNDELRMCSVFATSVLDRVTISDLVRGVAAALEGCPVPIITTVAGTGLAGLNDDGEPPLETHLYLPQDVTVGPDGLLYLVDWNNHRIRRIDPDGVVETIAGTGELGDAQDGVAIYTQFNHPTNVFFDGDGHMIIAAWHNSLVKRLDFSTGLVTNVAGTGARSFGGDGGPANSAFLDLPSAVVVDSSGNIIISDQANFRLRLVEPDGTIHTICGDGVPGFAGDGGPASEAKLNALKGQAAAPSSRIDIDRRDQIYIADTANHRIRMIDAVGIITTIAGTGEPGYSGDGGPATAAQLDTPSDVAVADNGTVYIADTMNHVIRVIRPNGMIETLAGTGERGFDGDGGPAGEGLLDRPYGIGLAPNGTLYIADTHNQRIRRVTGISTGPIPPPPPLPTPVIVPCTGVEGSICTYAGTGFSAFDGDGKDRLYTTLYWPFDMEFTASGRRIVLDWNNHRVREILPDDTFLTIAGTDFVGDGPADLSDLTPAGADPLTVDLNHPTDIQEMPNGDVLIVAWHNHKFREIGGEDGRVRVTFGAGAGFAGDGGPAIDARANQPARASLDAHGNLFLVDQRNQRIRVFYNYAEDRGAALVATVAGSGVRGFNGDGEALATQFNFPTGGNPEPTGGIAIAADGAIYFADTNNDRIRRIDFTSGDFLSGTVTTVAGSGTRGYSGDGGAAIEAQLSFPQDVEIGPDGNVYFTDTNNDRVRMIEVSTGIISTVAGSGEKGYSGDGGPAVEAKLNRPFGIAFDENGDLFISDSFNGRVRKVER